MLLRYTLKNIFSKPGRLIILLLCMTAACFSGFLAVDFGNTFKMFLHDMVSGQIGKIDHEVIYYGSDGITDKTFEGAPPLEYTCEMFTSKREVTRDEKNYSYAITDTVYVLAFSDMDIIHRMEMLPENIMPEEGQIAISRSCSEKFGYEVGDTFTVPDKDYNDVSFTVSSIYPDVTVYGQYSAVISKDSYVMLCGEKPYYTAYLTMDPADWETFEQWMEQERPTATVQKTYISEEMDNLLDTLTGIFYLVFVLVFVLVIFVVVSFTEKLITERMSVIGTLRSIGMSMRKTTGILLFENVLYALAGASLALLIYIPLRQMVLDKLVDEITFGSSDVRLNYGMMILVVLGAVLIQVLVPLKEVMKAVKTSIRDIIFENRDSEYRLSLPKTIVGAVFIAAGLVLGFAFKDLYLSSLAVLLLIVGSGLMIQFIVRKITWALAKFFGKRGMPVAELAATETGSKKPNSGNAVLAVSAVAAATAISIMASSILTALESPIYDTDIVISEASLKTDKYDYIEETEGVDDIEYLYRVSDNVSYDESVSFNPFEVLSLPDSTAYKALGELPNELGKTEFIADRPAADKMGIGVGDSITLTFHSDGIFPIKKELTLAKVTDKTEFGSIGQIIISKDLYKDLFPDTVSAMLIRSSDPASLKAALEPTFTKGEKVQTMAEYDEESKQDSNVLTGGMLGVMIASVVLTLIGISGNQVIGFAARKKEYAMLHSCACSRSKIIRMILIENALLFGISCLMAAVICIPVSALISRIFILSQMGIYVDLEFSALFGCILILWIITMLTSLTPIKSLKKMNTAMELKYE